jgi:class 3 adenylate cyclase
MRNKSLQKKKLACIMFTNIVGYTSLMGNDQAQAFKLLILYKHRMTKQDDKWCGL